MRETRPEAMEKVFADEGGYTNDPHDPGGATNFGITLTDARLHWKADATKEDVRAMPKAVAAQIYDLHYLRPMMYDSLPAGVDYAVVDAAINSGVGRAPKWLATALRTGATGMPALVTVASTTPDVQDVIHRYWSTRLGFLQSLKTWQFFGKGWGRRVATGEALSVRLWLKWGVKASTIQQKAALDGASKVAATKSTTQTKVATGHGGAGSVTAASASQWTDMPFVGKAAIVLLGLVFAGGLIFAIYWAIQHNRRSQAFAAEMEAVK